MTEREQRLLRGLLAFGWGSHDPYYAEKKGANEWIIHDTVFICPVCGGAAPESDTYPQLETFAVAANHLPACALAELLTEA